MLVQLVPKAITRTIVKGDVYIKNFNLATTTPPTISIDCYEPDNDTPFITLDTPLTPQIYEAWGTDNDVVINWALAQHGLEKQSPTL